MTRAHQEYLERAHAALESEIAAQRSEGGTSVGVEDGVRIADEALGATYRFTLPYEVLLPEGAPLDLQVGLRRWGAELLYRDGLTILLIVGREDYGLPDPAVPLAELLAQPWFLTEELRARIDDLRKRRLSAPAGQLVDRMTGTSAVRTVRDGPAVSGLNPEQSVAVHACSQETLWFVWGPPGTGKTSTLGHVVGGLAERSETAIISAHSNVAVDAALVASFDVLRQTNAGRSLIDAGKVVRVGPASTAEAQASGLGSREQALARSPDLTNRQRRLEKELRIIAAGRGEGNVQVIRQELKALRKALGEAEKRLIANADIMFCTLSKVVLSKEIRQRRFDVAVVDEVSMATPPQVVVAGSLADRRLAVFGDFRQLPPIVISEELETRKVLGVDAFTAAGVDHAAADDVAPGITMLREQYRMAPAIRSLVSSFAYGGRLRDGEGVVDRTARLADRPSEPGAPVVWRNVALHGARAWSDARRSSRANPVSAVLAMRDALACAGPEHSVVLLAPYRPQVRLLTALLREAGAVDQVSLGTVHRFQGSEGDSVILDLVDAPPLPLPGRPLRGMPGERLLNVGISRARGKLVVLGHSSLANAEDSFRSSARLLQRIARHDVAVAPGWEVRAEGLVMRHDPRVPTDLEQLASDDVSAIWLSPGAPHLLGAIGSSRALEAPDGQAVVLAGDRSWLLARVPGGTWETITVTSPRFANAVSEVLAGSALTSVRTSPDKAGSIVARYDRCAACGGAAELVETRGHWVTLDCLVCDTQRWPTLPELDSWCWTVGFRCPECSGAMRAKKGTKRGSRAFLSCASYPRCTGMAYVSELVGRAPVPEAERPTKPVAPATTTRKRKTPPAAARTRSGHKLAELAEFEDFGIERAEAAAWLDLGLPASQAVDLIGAGIAVAEAQRRCDEGTDPLDMWRTIRAKRS